MKNIVLLFYLFLAVVNHSAANSSNEDFEIFRGTNLAHWLSQSQRRGTDREEFITKSDIIAIARMGFDHVRLPVDEEQLWDENGNRYGEAFRLMKNCIDWCAENDLRVIIDLHILRSHYFNAEEKPLWTDPAEQQKFYDLWRDLSSFLSSYPNSLVAYELMNEAVADEPGQWNKLVAKAVAAIREKEPERTIVIGSNRWQSVDTFDQLRVPENDPHLLLSFHFYEPFLLTHYNASWTYLKGYSGPVHYPGIILSKEAFEQLPARMKPVAEKWVGKEFNKDWMLEKWEKPLQLAKKLNLPLYCGEFGVLSEAPEAARRNWYRDVIELFEETGIGYANWNYKSTGFGLVNGDGSRNEELIQIISGDK